MCKETASDKWGQRSVAEGRVKTHQRIVLLRKLPGEFFPVRPIKPYFMANIPLFKLNEPKTKALHSLGALAH